MDMSISKELTPGLCPAWKPRVGAALVMPLPAGCCRFELGQAFISGRAELPAPAPGIDDSWQAPGRGRKGLWLQRRGAVGS